MSMDRPSSPIILPTNETTDDTESLMSSIVESSIVESSVVDSSSEIEGDHIAACNDSQHYTDISKLPIYDQFLESNNIRKQLEQITPLATYSNISIANSSNVVVGNVIKVKGILNINVYKDKDKNNRNVGNQEENNVEKREEYIERKSSQSSETLNINNINDAALCRIIPRNFWHSLDPPPDGFEVIHEPVDIVIICHTATNSSNIMRENMEIIRNIQTYHIDTQNWDDIGYNFLIGDDGNVYEGRGWGVVGVHTYRYNRRSVGIAFIGNFMRSLPTEKALNSCKSLLKRGTEEDHLTSNYKLLGHRQCIATSSPGKLLYDEITKWENFYDMNTNERL